MPSFSSASISPKVITACLALIACYAPLVHPHILRAQVMPPSPDQSPPQLLTQSKEQSQTQMGIALIEQALKTTQEVEAPSERAYLQTQIALMLLKAQEKERAEQVFADVSIDLNQLNENVGNSLAHERLTAIFKLLIEAGESQRVVKFTFKEPLKLIVIQQLKEESDQLRVGGNTHKSQQLLNRALLLARELGNYDVIQLTNHHCSSERSETLSDLAINFARADQITQALELTQEIRDCISANRINRVPYQTLAFSAITRNIKTKNQLQQTYQAAQNLEDGEVKLEVLSDLVIKALEGQQPTLAFQMLDTLKNHSTYRTPPAPPFEGPPPYLERLYPLLETLVVHKHTEQVLAFLRETSDRTFQSLAYGQIARTLAKEEQLEQALEMAERLDQPKNQILSQVAISGILLKQGKTDQRNTILAETFFTRISTLPMVDQEEVALAFKDSRQFEAALNVTHAIEGDLKRKDETLASIVKALVEARQVERSQQVASKIQTPEAKGLAFSEISDAYVKEGRFQQALNLAQKISKDHNSYNLALSGIFKERLKRKQYDQALAIVRQQTDGHSSRRDLVEQLVADQQIKKAIKIARGIKDKDWRDIAFTDITRELSKTGQFKSAFRLVQKMVKERPGKPSANAAIAMVSRTAKTEAQLEKVLNLYASQEETEYMSRDNLQAFSEKLVELRLLDRALQFMPLLKPYSRNEFLSFLAQDINKQRDLGEALSLVQQIQDYPQLKDETHSQIVSTLLRQGKTSQAVDVVHQVKDSAIRASLFIEIASSLLASS